MNATPTSLRTLLGNSPNTAALKRGAIASPLVSFEFTEVKAVNHAFKRVVRDHAFDIAELALVTFLQAKAYGKPLVLMPALPGEGRFQHHCLAYNTERGPLGVENLAGKRIGIRAHAQTTVAWVRGILSDDYGVDLDSIEWVTFEDGHLAEFADPPGMLRAPEGKVMGQMLLDGELDAAILGAELSADPRIKPLLPDPFVAAQAWGVRHQILPINHMVAVDATLCRERPDIVREVYRLLQESKRLAEPQGGIDMTPFGVEPNRRALELLIRYSHEQRLIPRRYEVDELFDDVTRYL